MGASCSMALLSQVSTSYPRVLRDSFARTRACFLIIQLSGYGQFMLSTSFLPLHGCWSLHYDLCPSYFHTHSDRYAFSRWSWTFPVPANLLLSEMDIPFYTWPVCFLTFSLSFHTLESYHQASDCTENDNSQMFAKKYLLFFGRIDPETICYVQYFFSPWVSMYWRITSTVVPATGTFISIDKFTKFCSRLSTEHYMHMINVMVLLYHRPCYRTSVLFIFMQFISNL